MSEPVLTVPRAIKEHQNALHGYKTKALYRLRAAVLAELKKAAKESIEKL